jgi:hypothetical protein
MMPREARRIERGDILSPETYAQRRSELRKDLVAKKRDRRLAIGPVVMLYFESFDTMLGQVQEMLHIEKGGEAQIEDELRAYNPLIPQGRELVATMMIEIDDPIRRARTLAQLGHIEEKVSLQFDGQEVTAIPEDDAERTTPDGKTASVHFLHFRFTDAQVAKFRGAKQVIAAITHPNYGHLAIMPEAVQQALAADFA